MDQTTNVNSSGATTGVNQAPIPESLPPVLTDFIKALSPTLYILTCCAVWLGVIIPILVILFFTSTKSLRRSGIFISNAIAVCIGIVMGILSIAFQINGVLDPIKGVSRPAVLAYSGLVSSAGMYIDCVLLFRVMVVYPKERTSGRLWYGIMTPLVLFKIARSINFIVFMVLFGIQTRTLKSIGQYPPVARGMVGSTIEWSLQLADNALCSSLFLWRLNQGQSFSEKTVASLRNQSSYYKALGTLFWIATTNFVFPCVFDIIAFILFYRDSNTDHYLMVLISNAYIQIIGVLFATIWKATNENGMNTVELSSLPRTQLHTLEFAARTTDTGIGSMMVTADIGKDSAQTRQS